MYEKLVNRLRKAAGPAIDFPDTLYDEAADAIEELSKSRWVPVTERLPEEKRDGLSEDVLVLVENPDGDITWQDIFVGYYLYDATSEETGWWTMMTCGCAKIGEHQHGDKIFRRTSMSLIGCRSRSRRRRKHD